MPSTRGGRPKRCSFSQVCAQPQPCCAVLRAAFTAAHIDGHMSLHSPCTTSQRTHHSPPSAFVCELIDRPGKPICNIEKYAPPVPTLRRHLPAIFPPTQPRPSRFRFVEGDYVKYSNNDGWSEDRRNTPHAFSHFTFEASGRQLIVCDIQGVCACAACVRVRVRVHVCVCVTRAFLFSRTHSPLMQASATFTPTPKSTRWTAGEWGWATTGARAYSDGSPATDATLFAGSSSCPRCT